MARKTVTSLVDDLDGSVATRTVAFGWQGRSYEIDLSKKNIAAFEKALKPYLSSARTASGGRGKTRTAGRRGAKARAAARPDLSDVRGWARANGFDVSDRGRIPNAVIEAYDAAK